jgi:hypothetical protein
MKKPIRKAGESSESNHRVPLWKGPQEDGISFSLLSRFLECRERFRLKTVEGLEEDEGFNSAMEYGSLWHEMEEAFATGKDPKKAAGRYRDKLRGRYPAAEASINKWFKLAIRQFPIYLNHWWRHPETKKRKFILAEIAFRVPYQLPSGRTLHLRGKWDGVFQEGKKGFEQENKTKGRIDEAGLQGTVHENLQTMLYLIALLEEQDRARKKLPSLCLSRKQVKTIRLLPMSGVLYNVIRRPLSDQHAQKQRKGREVWNADKTRKIRKGAETEDQFLDRVADDIRKEPDHHFMRWKARIFKKDIERFKAECFDPILEQLVDWWDWIKADPFDPFRVPRAGELCGTAPLIDCPGGGKHFRFPWGVYHSLASGFRGSYFEYLSQGRKDKLVPINSLFPELEGD